MSLITPNRSHKNNEVDKTMFTSQLLIVMHVILKEVKHIVLWVYLVIKLYSTMYVLKKKAQEQT